MNKKILFNVNTFENGNLIALVLKAKYFQRNSFDITFFGSKELKKSIDSFNVTNFNFIELSNVHKITTRLQFISESFYRNIRSLKFLNDFNNSFDIVYSISSVLDLIIFPYILKALNKKIKWVTVFDNTVPLFVNGKIIAGDKTVRMLAWLFYRLSLILLKKADYIFVVKPSLKTELMGRGFKDNQLVVTGNGIETDLIKSAKAYPDKYNYDALFIGRINEAKGIYDMLDVLDIVVKKIPTFKLAIMGKGDVATELAYKKEIEKRKLQNNIVFLGYRTGQDKYDIIKSSKCFLFLSETESVPQAPLEAVCSGLKAFVYDIEAYEMYKNNELLISKLNDVDEVAKKLLELFKSGDFENKQGKKLLEKYSWDRIAEIELRMMNT